MQIVNVNKSFLKTRYGPDGIHVFDRQTGLNLLLDESVPNRKIWTLAPRQVSIALTNNCNLQCKHCYAPKSKSFLDKSLVKKWMKELDLAGSFGIGFGGGEPTLHPDFNEICHYGKNETSLAITFTTHGLTLRESLIKNIEDNVNFTRVSMDGVGETYESIRGCSFDSFLKKLSLLTGRINFGINYVVNRDTLKDIEQAIYIAELYGASEVLFLPEEAVGLGCQVDTQTLDKLSSWAGQYKGKLRLSISSLRKSSVNYLNALENELEHLAYSHIDADGLLKKTSFDKMGYKISEEGVMKSFEKLCNAEKRII
jgi:organic radical activating enzyme